MFRWRAVGVPILATSPGQCPLSCCRRLHVFSRSKRVLVGNGTSCHATCVLIPRVARCVRVGLATLDPDPATAGQVTVLCVRGLPIVTPLNMGRGRDAFEGALLATRRALGKPRAGSGVVYAHAGATATQYRSKL